MAAQATCAGGELGLRVAHLHHCVSLLHHIERALFLEARLHTAAASSRRVDASMRVAGEAITICRWPDGHVDSLSN